MSTHTPTPWAMAEITRIHLDRARVIRTVKEGMEHGAIAAFNIGAEGEVAAANAELIVRAVNNHEALLAFAVWAMREFQGDSGTGHSHWEQFKEYRLGLAAIDSATKGQP